ncbi:MAG: hypothetical protein RLZZ347_653, partial [Candidatus Parcubacteria bacterium]
TKTKILERIQKGDLSFSPALDSFQLQEHAIDLRMGFTFLLPKRWKMSNAGREALDTMHFDKANAEYFDIIELEQGQYFDLLPGEYVMVSTLESIRLSKDIMAVLYPRSSTNRKGLSLDLTGIVDAGYEGQLTLPIRNNTSSQIVRLYPGERICQITLDTLTEAVEPRKSKYHKKDIIEGVAREKQVEAKLILSGKIKDLKAKYPAKK